MINNFNRKNVIYSHEKEKHKIHFDGFTFDSKRQLERYKELKELADKNLIKDLTLKKEFNIESAEIGFLKSLNGKPLRYFVDFYYETSDGQRIYEDVKRHLDEFTFCKQQLVQIFKKIKIKIV